MEHIGLFVQSLVFGREHEGHITSFKLRLLLDDCCFQGIFDQLFEDSSTQVSVSHLATAEPYGHFRLVAIGEKPLYVFKLELVVVLLGLRPELHLLYDHRVLVFFCLFGPFALLELVFAVVHYSANGRR